MREPPTMAIAAKRGGVWGVLLLSNDAERFFPWSDARQLVRDMSQCCDVIERTHPAVVNA